MKYSWTKIKELICLFNGFLSFLLDELITILSSEIFLNYFESFFMHTVMYRFANTKNHVKHKVPIVMVEPNETFSCVFFFLQLVNMVAHACTVARLSSNFV